MRRAVSLPILLLALTLVACTAPASRQATDDPPGAPARTAAPKRIVASIMDEPPVLSTQLGPPSARGLDAVEELVHAGMATIDRQGGLRAQLAEVPPSVENGLLHVLPDGRMETTWKIRPEARWHDGTPVTAEDFRFTLQVAQDRDIAVFRDVAHDGIDGVTVVDPRTVTVSWSRPYIFADRIFTNSSTMPHPRHLLEPTFLADKANYTTAPYWTDQFVGAGPFKVRDWTLGSHLSLAAFEGYALGRPKVDEIEIRFIPDPNALAATVLAGAVELTLGRGLDVEQAIRIRDQWQEGKMDVSSLNWLVLWPQHVNSSPAAVADPQFRRAIMHGTDRQQLVDNLMSGVTAVAHSFVSPEDPDYRDVESRIVRYEFDPRRATSMLEGLGYTRGADGIFRDTAGQRMAVEVRTTAGDLLREKVLLSVADDWNRVGVAADPFIVPRQRASDQEYRATFPGFELVRQPNTNAAVATLHSRAARLPENNYVGVGGTNYARYANPQFDALVDRFFVTIPRADRVRVLADIVGHMTENLTAMGTFYAANPSMIGNRLVNVAARTQQSTETWNAHEWDVAR
jgi:peptide/nickel transport system substrate-binding protein